MWSLRQHLAAARPWLHETEKSGWEMLGGRNPSRSDRIARMAGKSLPEIWGLPVPTPHNGCRPWDPEQAKGHKPLDEFLRRAY